MISRSLTTRIFKHSISSEATVGFWKPGQGHVFWGVYSASTSHKQTPQDLGFMSEGAQQEVVTALVKKQRLGVGAAVTTESFTHSCSGP